jgi:hypothetical protein
MMWIYGICDGTEPLPPGSRGLAGAPLEALGEGGLLAVFTRHAQPPCDPAPDALWAHEQVVERLMAERTVVPLRFGSTVAGEAALRRLLAERRESLTETIARIRGRVELGVRVLDEAPAAVADEPRSGRDYVLGRLQDSRRAEHATAALHEPLAVLARDAVRQPLRAADELLRGAYLVDRAGVPRFCTGVQRLQAEHPDMAILCTGPWPAYSFVG